jgi:hypothetical protein
MGLAGSHRPRAPTRPATWVPDRFRIHPLNALSQAPFPMPRVAAALGRQGPVNAVPAPGPAGPQVMHGGYIAGIFSSSDRGSPECRHNVDVSEAC